AGVHDPPAAAAVRAAGRAGLLRAVRPAVLRAAGRAAQEDAGDPGPVRGHRARRPLVRALHAGLPVALPGGRAPGLRVAGAGHRPAVRRPADRLDHVVRHAVPDPPGLAEPHGPGDPWEQRGAAGRGGDGGVGSGVQRSSWGAPQRGRRASVVFRAPLPAPPLTGADTPLYTLRPRSRRKTESAIPVDRIRTLDLSLRLRLLGVITPGRGGDVVRAPDLRGW